MVYDRSVVYKIFMIRMTPSKRVSDELGKVKLLDFEHSEMNGILPHEVKMVSEVE